jgi:hypothetical protein
MEERWEHELGLDSWDHGRDGGCRDRGGFFSV